APGVRAARPDRPPAGAAGDVRALPNLNGGHHAGPGRARFAGPVWPAALGTWPALRRSHRLGGRGPGDQPWLLSPVRCRSCARETLCGGVGTAAVVREPVLDLGDGGGGGEQVAGDELVVVVGRGLVVG